MSERLKKIKQKLNHEIDYKDIVWLIEQVEKLQNNWDTLYQFLENTTKLEDDCVMLIDLMDDIKNGLVK
ncbi:hypothetical protein ACFPA1_21030 [Neobacillus sp. GCM10023253]|uniref:hypothetical protein n=1 Tax=Neobacillus sp. GCM10023253 TaxID=3252644 RepID=UPI00361C0EA2